MTVYRDRIKTIEASTNVQIDPSGVPDCRLPDGVRDAVNSARANANSASTRRAETGMPAATNDGRQSSRTSRASRLKTHGNMPKCRERHNALVDVVNEIERLMK